MLDIYIYIYMYIYIYVHIYPHIKMYHLMYMLLLKVGLDPHEDMIRQENPDPRAAEWLLDEGMQRTRGRPTGGAPEALMSRSREALEAFGASKWMVQRLINIIWLVVWNILFPSYFGNDHPN